MMGFQDQIIQQIRKIAKLENWIELDHQENIKMISFSNAVDRINIYYSKMTVATCINHPKKGSTQLFRRNVTFRELAEIFQKPRIHTKDITKRRNPMINILKNRVAYLGLSAQDFRSFLLEKLLVTHLELATDPKLVSKLMKIESIWTEYEETREAEHKARTLKPFFLEAEWGHYMDRVGGA